MIRRVVIAAVILASAATAPGGPSRRDLRFHRRFNRIEIRPEIRLARARAGYPGLQVLANSTAVAANLTGFPWLIPLRFAIPAVRYMAQKKLSK